MDEINNYIALIIFGSYLAGSIPFGKIIGLKIANIDITSRGSGNIGATNVAREIGLKWGALTLLMDLLKGFVPVILARLLFPSLESPWAMVGLAALLGHQFSAFSRFKGGKGVATALGIYLALCPIPCLLALILFIVVVLICDFVSLGSILSAFAMPPLLAYFGRSKSLIISSLIIAILILAKHQGNVKRLVTGKEFKWSQRGSKLTDQGDGPAHH